MAKSNQNTDDKQSPETAEAEDVVVEDAVVEASQDEEAIKDSPAPRRGMSIALGLVLGGVIAAGIGFYAARYVVPEGWPFPGVTPDPDPIAVAQLAQAGQIEALESQLKAQSEALATFQADQSVTDLAAQVGGFEARLTGLTDLLNQLDARLLAVEKIPRGSGTEAADAAAAAYERELSQMRAMLSEELAKIEAAQIEAQASGLNALQVAAEASKQAALAEIRTALNNGQPFSDALQILALDGGPAISDVLSDAASDGVMTLSSLQDEFPMAARAALSASISAAVSDGSVSRFSGFLRNQLGTRSLEPKEGSDPDAVLSRAEAALKSGQIAAALQELSALPDEGQAEMVVWISNAQTRLDVLDATDTLTREINGE